MKNRSMVEIGGIISVIGSLVFVGVEISQNTAAVRGATQYAVSGQITEMYRIVAENEKIASIMSQAYKGIHKSDLSETDYTRFWLFSSMGFWRVENIHLQYKNGLLSEEAFERIGMAFYRTPLVREIWEKDKEAYNPDFVTFFDNLRDGEK